MNSSDPRSTPKTVEAPPRPRAVFARHAASLLVVRDGPSGPEVLMGMRGAGHRFMPNRLVFPGGAVDPEDGAAAAATEPRPGVLALLARRARPRLARALAVCAARELAEETGMSLGVPPGLDGLDYLCRAVTPPDSPIRFNARFLVVDARCTQGAAADSHELQDVGFRNVEQVLQQGLMLVTAEVLRRFLAWHEAGRGSGSGSPAPMVFQRRRWVMD